MSDNTYSPKTYRKNGGDEIVIASGGKITIEDGGEVVREVSEFVKGQKFVIQAPVTAYDGFPVAFFIAPAACKITSVQEAHGVAAGTTNTLIVEKLTGTKAAGSGDSVLAAAINVAGTADTVITQAATTGAVATLAAGDRVGIKLSAVGTALASVKTTIVAEWV